MAGPKPLKPAFKPGIMRMGGDTLQKAIVAVLIERVASGTGGVIALFDLGRAVGEDNLTRVQLACKFLTERGVLTDPGKSWCEITSFELRGIQFNVSPVQGTLGIGASEHDEEEFDREHFNIAPVRDRKAAGWEQKIADDVVYKVEIRAVHESDESDGTLYYRLDISARDVGDVDGAWLVKVEDHRFPNREDAWAFWDEWIADYDALDYAEEQALAEDEEEASREEEHAADEEPGGGLTEADEDLFFEHEMEDGEHVTVRLRATGGGWYRMTVTGPVCDAGEMVKSIRSSELGEDPEGASLQIVEALRKEYLEATRVA